MANIKIATVKPMTIKDRVQFTLKKKGLSSLQMEQDLGFAKGYVSKLDKASPSADKLEKIANYLDVSMDWLISGKNITIKAPSIKHSITIHSVGAVSSTNHKKEIINGKALEGRKLAKIGVDLGNTYSINTFPQVSDEAKKIMLAYDSAPDYQKKAIRDLLGLHESET